ncbi:MAG: hypothetical protein HKP61_01690 [Dactylosporangium sp.]|nr:hypothetical protein [Dactylosporangium sp.]NNJ59676.1 hypothetical protein [Dactylosporangium sp.]
MVNRAHLCVSNHESIYPTFGDPSYDPTVNTVATCARSVPLLWFALFRPKDLVKRVFDTDDGPYVVIAPIAPCVQALANLTAALPRLVELFAVQGSLDENARLLARAILQAPGDRVTIEWDEIDVITEGDFLADAAAAMSSLDPATPGDTVADRARLLRLSGIGRPDRRFPHPTAALGGDQGNFQETGPQSRLIGVRLGGFFG